MAFLQLLLGLLIVSFSLADSQLTPDIPINASSPPFVEELAYEALYLSYAAFCNRSALVDWSCQWCNPQSPLQLLAFLENKLAGTRGYVALDSPNNKMVVSFRGSSNLPNYLEDAEAIALVKFPYVPPDPTPDLADVKVAYGFLSAYKSLRDNMMTAVEQGLKQCPQCVIQFVGHSLGAAMASIAALDITLHIPTSPVSMYTFGCPRSGNVAWSDWLIRNTGPNFRMTRQHDPVPGLPFQHMLLAQYHHYSTEVYNTFDVNGLQTYTVCDGSGEDHTCYDSQSGIIKNPAQHTQYMGMQGGGCIGG